MTLQEFLSFIADEEVRIELEIDIESEDDYLYTSFWFSDYAVRKAENFEYAEWIVESISFVPVMYSEAQISIQIKKINNMEAPDKIYLDIRGFENVDIPFSLARKRFGVSYYEYPVSNNDVEYTRTDVIVERAIRWIDDNNRNGGCFFEGWENDFKNYMKGE